MENKHIADPEFFNLSSIVPSSSNGGGDVSYRPKKKTKPTDNHTQSSNPDNFSSVLKNYSEVPMAAIGTLHVNDFIKYINSDGVLKSSGKIKSMIHESDGSWTFTLTSFNGKKGIRWNINSKKMSHIYRHTGHQDHDDHQTHLDNIVRNVEIDDTLKNKVLALESRIQVLENSLKNVINYINTINEPNTEYTV